MMKNAAPALLLALCLAAPAFAQNAPAPTNDEQAASTVRDTCAGPWESKGITMYASGVTHSRADAEVIAAELPARERCYKATHDYLDAQNLIETYQSGIAYIDHHDLAHGGRRYTIAGPDFPKLLALLAELAERGDSYAALELSHYFDADYLKRDSSTDYREFPPDPARRRQLLQQAAAPAVDIIEGRGVYANNRAVQERHRANYEVLEHAAVAKALEQLADANFTGDAASPPDWKRASDEYSRLITLIGSPDVKSDDRLNTSKERAVLRLADMQLHGGNGVVQNCDAAFASLEKKVADIDATVREAQYWGSREKTRMIGPLQSLLGLAYLRGCGAIPPNPAKALAAFTNYPADTDLDKVGYYGCPRVDHCRSELTQEARRALGDLLDRGAPGIAPQPKAAFDVLWTLDLDGPLAFRLAQMIEEGKKYTNIEPQRALLFYCRAAHEFGYAPAKQWLAAHPAVRCKK